MYKDVQGMHLTALLKAIQQVLQLREPILMQDPLPVCQQLQALLPAIKGAMRIQCAGLTRKLILKF